MVPSRSVTSLLLGPPNAAAAGAPLLVAVTRSGVNLRPVTKEETARRRTADNRIFLDGADVVSSLSRRKEWAQISSRISVLGNGRKHLVTRETVQYQPPRTSLCIVFYTHSWSNLLCDLYSKSLSV